MKRNTLISFEIKQENLEKIRLHMARTTKEQIAFDILTSNDRKCLCEAQSKYILKRFAVSIAYDHTTLNTPHLVRSGKLSNVGPG